MARKKTTGKPSARKPSARALRSVKPMADMLKLELAHEQLMPADVRAQLLAVIHEYSPIVGPIILRVTLQALMARFPQLGPIFAALIDYLQNHPETASMLVSEPIPAAASFEPELPSVLDVS